MRGEKRHASPGGWVVLRFDPALRNSWATFTHSAVECSCISHTKQQCVQQSWDAGYDDLIWRVQPRETFPERWRTCEKSYKALRLRRFLGVLIVTAPGCTRTSTAPEPTAADAKTFLDTVNETLKRLSIDAESGRLGGSRTTSPTTPRRSTRARTSRLIEAVARFAKESTRFDKVEVPPDQRRQLESAETSPRDGDASRSQGSRGADEDRLAHARRIRQGQMVPRPGEAGDLPEHRRHHASHGDVAQRDGAAAGLGGLAHDLAADARTTTRASSSCRTRARRSSASPTPARCGARSTTCRPTSSRRSSIGCGIRCGRSTCSCTPTSA